jgi:hypothetical protein
MQDTPRQARLSVSRSAALVIVLFAILLATNALRTQPALAFSISSFDGEVSNQDGSAATQAGSHPFSASTTISFPTLGTGFEGIAADGGVRTIVVDLPPGLIGSPAQIPQCTEAQFENNVCPVSSQIGVTEVTFAYGPHPVFQIFNLVPTLDEPAEFGFHVGTVPVHLAARVRSESDYGLTIEARAISQGLPLAATQVTFWGVPSDPAHDAERGPCLNSGGELCPSQSPSTVFLRNPTSCVGPLTTTASADSWYEPGEFASNSFVSHLAPPNQAVPVGVEGCERVPFTPTLSVRPDTGQAGAPAGLSVDVALPQEENSEGLAQADVRKVQVTLPQGMSISPAAAGGLTGCTNEQLNIHSIADPSCPPASVIGTVQINTPLLKEPMLGSVYLGQPLSSDSQSGQMFRLFLVVKGPGVIIKLAGSVIPNPTTGQLTATFDNNPQLPFSLLHLQLKSGPRAPVLNPPACGTYTTNAQLTSWSGKTVESSSSFQVTEGENGAPCPAGAFAPSFTAGTVSNQAGALSPFALTFARSDAQQTLRAISVHMPPGLLGVIKGVEQCPEPQASRGTCGPGSVLGHTTVGAGGGSSPFYVGGQVFLTGPYKGAPFGLSIVVPAVAGPFDLGTVVVRAAIGIDPHTAQVTVTSDPLPTILQGVPLQLRTVNVIVDRQGFMFNPTGCTPSAVNATIASTAGASASVGSPFQAANCANLPFKPSLSASTQGNGSFNGKGASLLVKVGSKGGPGLKAGEEEANIAKVDVQLPIALPSRLSTLQKACTEAQFAKNPAGCPEASDVGTAVAHTPVLPDALEGPAYLVSHGGAAFPDLVLVLQGDGVTIDLTGNTQIKKGITSSKFEAVPDAPISSFEVRLPEGSHSVFAANKNLCAPTKMVTVQKRVARRVHGQLKRVLVKVKQAVAETLVMPTTITGQNGAVLQQTTKLAVTGCAKAAAKRAGAKRKPIAKKGKRK